MIITTGWRRGRAVVVAMVALAAVGCDASAEAPPDTAAGQVDVIPQETMQNDEQTAVSAVDAFWRSRFSELTGQPYESPRVAGPYTGSNGPSCAGQPSVPYNAFYCYPGDFIAWDDNLMASGYSQIGDAWIYLIIAHEWGHAIQARLDADRVSVQAELQADCLAGAALQGAADDGLIVFEPGDSEEIAKTLAAVADDYPWTDQGDHGNAEERTAAFNAGTSGGVQACIS